MIDTKKSAIFLVALLVALFAAGICLVDRANPAGASPLHTPSSMTLLVDPVVSPTDQPTQTITGETAPGALVGVVCESGQFSGNADANGNFAVEIDLALGVTNHLEVYAYSGQEWASATVDRNGDPLEIEQTSPPPPPMTLLVDPVISPTDQPTQTITGETAPEVLISIVDLDGWGYGWGEADANGDFAVEIALTLGAINHLQVTAIGGNGGPGAGDCVSTTVDRNGNPLDIEQTSTPPPPLTLLVDPVISPTDQPTQTITGETAPGASVAIVGEGGWAWGEADPNSNFAIEINLALGITNHLRVYAYAGWDWASTTVDRNGDPLEIVQTSTPPTLTLLVDPVISPTDQPTQTITGETAPGASVSVIDLDGQGWGRGTADANGDFAVEVELTLGALNRLEVSAFSGNGDLGASVSTTVDRNGDPLEIEQTSPLPPPLTLLVDPVVSPTDQPTQTITGETAPGAQVEVVGGASWVRWGEADAAGLFAIEVDLLLGQINYLEVYAYSGQEWVSATVDRNGDPLEIEQTSPPPPPMTLLVDPVVSPTDQPTQTVTGETAPGASISIMDLAGWGYGWGEADANGNFAVEVELTLGDFNHLKVFACTQDRPCGNGDCVSTMVDRNGDPLDIEQTSPPLPPMTLLVDPVTSPTDLLTQTITGETAPGAWVDIAGEGGWASGQADGNGLFAIEIDLAPGVTNHLEVFVGAPGSNDFASATVDRNGDPLDIVQTSSQPTLPLLVDPVSSYTNLAFQTITGETAPRALVEVECDGHTFEGQAGASGYFVIEVSLTLGATNHLAVRAADPSSGGFAGTTMDRDGDPLRVNQTSSVVQIFLPMIVRQ